jgi:hypothetical protein
LNLVCHAFACVRTSVPMRVGIELFVSGQSTVKQSAWRLNLFFKAGTSTPQSREPGRCRFGAVPTGAASDPIHRIGRLLNTLTPHRFLCRNPHAPSAETGCDSIGNLGLMASRSGQPVFTPRRPTARAIAWGPWKKARRDLRRGGTIANVPKAPSYRPKGTFRSIARRYHQKWGALTVCRKIRRPPASGLFMALKVTAICLVSDII